MKIELLNNNEKPREKIIDQGAENLSDIELLAIMLGSGTKTESVLDLSARLLNEYSMKQLFSMNYNNLSKINGIKKAKATKLMACFEIARRVSKSQNNDIKLFNTKDIFEYIRADYYLLDYEMLSVILLGNSNKLIKVIKYTNKEFDECIIPIKKIVNEAINTNCLAVVLVHNHPGGNLNISRDDIIGTKKLYEILNNMGISLLDHIIISNDNYTSFVLKRLKIDNL